MTDGPTEATDLEKTEVNKKLVRSFVEDVFVNVNLDKFASYFDGINIFSTTRAGVTAPPRWATD